MQLSRVLLAGAVTLLFSAGDAFPLHIFSKSLGTRSTASHHQISGTVRAFDTEPGDGDHSYFRPAAEDVSGVPGNDKPYHRSPCPAINVLANHGYLPRDGKQLTREMIKRAVMDAYHVGDGLGSLLVDKLPAALTLADMGRHNLIEHDASLVHDDQYFGGDPAQVNVTLVRGLLARATPEGMLTKPIVAQWRREREAESAATNPQFDFSFHRQASAYPEAAAFLVAMGDYKLESISVADAESFLLHERFPGDFKRCETEVTIPHTILVAGKIKALVIL